MRFKTSTKISLKFTLFTTVILLFFSALISIAFFHTWHSKQKDRLHFQREYAPPAMLTVVQRYAIDDGNNIILQELTQEPISGINLLVRDVGGRNINVIPPIPTSEFTKSNGWYPSSFLSFISRGRINLVYNHGHYFLYTQDSKMTRVGEVTEFIYSQMELMQTLLILDMIFILIVYLISIYFVSSSLKNLKKLTNYVENLDFEKQIKPLEIVGHKRDEIKLIANAFNASLEKIHSQITSLKDFTANASHELKTPLMMMNTEIDIALKKHDYEQRLLNIKGNVKRLSALLDTLSLITTLESGKKLQKQKIDKFPQLCQGIIDEIKIKYDRNIKLTVYSSSYDELGSNCQEGRWNANPELLKIVIKNLIENACKYAGEDVEITVSIGQHSFSVHDNGVGIAKDVHKQIFERFWQGEKSESGEHSFGLGLYLVKKIVELHGWKIEVKSEIGKGSEFIVKM